MIPPVKTYNVSRETFSSLLNIYERNRDLLTDYANQLLWWNRRLNLVSREMNATRLERHLLHSLTPTILDCWKTTSFAIDAGTGGGLPGIPMAIINPEIHWVLIDINKKKTLALKQIIRTLNLSNVNVIDTDIGEAEIKPGAFIVSKHAFRINDLYNKLNPKPWNSLAFLKGNEFHHELTNIPDACSIHSYRLETGTDDPFFTSKILLELKR